MCITVRSTDLKSKNFVTYIAQHEKNKIVSDIHQNDFISVLSDSSANVVDVEEEAIEVRLLDPWTFESTYRFLEDTEAGKCREDC